VAEDPAVSDRLLSIGIVARSSTPSEFSAAIEAQRTKVAAIADAVDIKPAQ
jgi:tripartite-type tricarboxylate transporter receptor subunit TctC